MSNTNKITGWQVRDVIYLAIIAIFFGVIYQLWSLPYTLIAATPLKPFANDLTIGVWVMAGPLASLIIKKPGAGILGEVIAATVEMFLFSQWGVLNLISGFIQGASAELGFTATGYHTWSKRNLFLSTIFMTIITFIWDLFQNGYLAYQLSLLISLFIIRFLSIGFFAGVLVYLIAKMLHQAGLR